MRNALTIARRVLSQFSHDKRTLALLFVAPVVVLWLLSVLLGADAYEPRLATVDLPASFQSALEEQDARITDASEAEAALIPENEHDELAERIAHYQRDYAEALAACEEVEGDSGTATDAGLEL